MDLEREASSSSSAVFMEEEGEEGLPTVMLKAMLSSAMMSRQEEEVEKGEEGEEQQGGKQKRRHSAMARPTASTSLLSQTLEHCLRAMFKGNPPQQKQSSVCGKIWGSGHMAYRCKNCQVTPNSCICVDCFQKGNHEGHDYRLYSSGYGGCCDCGDPEAWNPKGFCSDHGAQAPAQLQNFSQDVARELILTALRLLQRYLKQYLSVSRTRQNRRDSRKLITLLLWLHKVCSYGDIPRRIVAEVVVNLTQEQDVSKRQQDEEAESKQKTQAEGGDRAEISLTKKIAIPQATIIDLLLRACCHMERDEKKEDSDEEPKDTLSNSCMMLCMDCLYEPSFKATFAHRYVQNYGMLFLSSLHPGKTRQMDRILTTLGAQLFNIESLVVSITKQDKLLSTLLNLIILLVKEYSVLKKPQKRELPASSTAVVSAEGEGEKEEQAEVEVEEDGPETRRERELERQRHVEEMTELVEAVPEEAELLEQMVEARQHSSTSSQHPTDFSPRFKKEEEEEEEEVEKESTEAP